MADKTGYDKNIIAALADWRPRYFRAYSTSVTCSGAGGAGMAANAGDGIKTYGATVTY
jgi:hypothetical protein